MMIKFDEKYLGDFISDKEYDMMWPRVLEAHSKVVDSTDVGGEMLGWRDLPRNFDNDEFAHIKTVAQEVCEQDDILVVIGVGGSYLGARAVIELLAGSNATRQPCRVRSGRARQAEVIFTGKDLSSVELDRVLRKLDGKDWSINVISKSGTTTEPAIAFRILRRELERKYGDLANRRIYATTDARKGTLHDLAVANGWERFVVPDDVGGRFSVLTAVGLLPIAVAGIDIDDLMNGANLASSELAISSELAMKYAACRNILYEKGYGIEVMSSLEPSFAAMGEWWKQLFGESEGKDGMGIFPSSMIFTTDLHSLGQYVQDGKRQLFETFVRFKKSPIEIKIPEGGDGDGLGYLAGKNLSLVNEMAYKATAKAHHDGGVPVMTISLDKICARAIGEFVYFMELACAISAYTLGVNPFNQPGVEEYKNNMFRLLGK